MTFAIEWVVIEFCIPYYFKAPLQHLSFPRLFSVWKS